MNKKKVEKKIKILYFSMKTKNLFIRCNYQKFRKEFSEKRIGSNFVVKHKKVPGKRKIIIYSDKYYDKKKYYLHTVLKLIQLKKYFE